MFYEAKQLTMFVQFRKIYLRRNKFHSFETGVYANLVSEVRVTVPRGCG